VAAAAKPRGFRRTPFRSGKFSAEPRGFRAEIGLPGPKFRHGVRLEPELESTPSLLISRDKTTRLVPVPAGLTFVAASENDSQPLRDKREKPMAPNRLLAIAAVTGGTVLGIVSPAGIGLATPATASAASVQAVAAATDPDAGLDDTGAGTLDESDIGAPVDDGGVTDPATDPAPGADPDAGVAPVEDVGAVRRRAHEARDHVAGRRGAVHADVLRRRVPAAPAEDRVQRLVRQPALGRHVRRPRLGEPVRAGLCREGAQARR